MVDDNFNTRTVLDIPSQQLLFDNLFVSLTHYTLGYSPVLNIIKFNSSINLIGFNHRCRSFIGYVLFSLSFLL